MLHYIHAYINSYNHNYCVIISHNVIKLNYLNQNELIAVFLKNVLIFRT